MICVLADLLDVKSSSDRASSLTAGAMSAFLEPFLLLNPAVITELVFPTFFTDLAVFVVVYRWLWVRASSSPAAERTVPSKPPWLEFDVYLLDVKSPLERYY